MLPYPAKFFRTIFLTLKGDHFRVNTSTTLKDHSLGLHGKLFDTYCNGRQIGTCSLKKRLHYLYIETLFQIGHKPMKGNGNIFDGSKY